MIEQVGYWPYQTTVTRLPRRRSPSYPSSNVHCTVHVRVHRRSGLSLTTTEGDAEDLAAGCEGEVATLRPLRVVETGSLGPDTRSTLTERELIDRANETTGPGRREGRGSVARPGHQRREPGDPSKLIGDYIAENGIALAISGTHGQPDPGRYVMGVVSATLVRTSPVPVVWVREFDSGGTSGS